MVDSSKPKVTKHGIVIDPVDGRFSHKATPEERAEAGLPPARDGRGDLTGYKLIAIKRDEWNTIIAEEGADLLRIAIDAAKKGDKACLRILLERMLPALRSVEVSGEVATKTPQVNLQVNVGGETMDPELVAAARGGDREAMARVVALLTAVEEAGEG